MGWQVKASMPILILVLANVIMLEEVICGFQTLRKIKAVPILHLLIIRITQIQFLIEPLKVKTESQMIWHFMELVLKEASQSLKMELDNDAILT